MSRLDIVIFGATGFTGKYAVEEMVKLALKYPGITWGVAGRSKEKLRNMLAEISLKIGKDITNTKKIIADVYNEKSLGEMCSQVKVIANCCGPYFEVGEPVVRAAIASKTHYVDVAAEPVFMEAMQLHYDKQARDAGVYIICGCGFDSIPNDMGVLFLEQHFEGILNSVESYISLDIPQKCFGEIRKYGMLHKTSWDSILCTMICRRKLEDIRKKLFTKPFPAFKPEIPIRSIHRKDKSFCAQIVCPDESVVYRTQRHLYATEHKRPIQFKCYYKFSHLLEALSVVIGLVVLSFLTLFSWTSKLLLKYPKLITCGIITDEGPTEHVMDSTKIQAELYGEGWSGVEKGKPNRRVVAKVSTVNPYRASVIAQNIAAITILEDIGKMPGAGGVLTSGVAFRNTDLIRRLNENNMKFEIMKSTET